ncbi:hypothetical protein [Halomonas sp. WWR20]
MIAEQQIVYQERESTRHVNWLLMVGLIFLFALQFTQFIQGYRLTADGALFLQYAWQGWDQVWQAADTTAIHDGRVAQYFMTPLNALGSLLAGNIVTRGIMVAGYYGIMALFSVYASQLIAKEKFATTALIFLCLLSLHPLVYEHMPPTSYPLQNTLPFFIFISLRLYLWFRPQSPELLQGILYIVMALSMIVSEYVFLFATALIAAEHFANAASPQRETRQYYLGPIPIRARRLLEDSLLTLIVLVINIAFRVVFPSEYDGNTPDGLSNIGRFLTTAILHAFSGTAFYQIPKLDVTQVSVTTWAESILVGVVTLACCWPLLLRLPRFSLRKIVVLSVFSLLLMLYVTLPLAATSKYQTWCLEGGSCGYLDSRTSYLGIGILFLCLVTALSLVFKSERSRKCLLALVALVLSCMAALNYAGNQLMANDMKMKSQAWDNARQFACEENTSSSQLDILASKVDPNNRVDFHPFMNRHAYWLEYMQYLRTSEQCITTAR